MIKITVMYPNAPGSTFDMAYYLGSHIPLVRRKLGAAVKGVAVEQGLGGAQPGTPPAYLALGHLLFESVEAYQQAFEPHAQAILADIPHYTNTQPTIQISDVKMS